MKSLSSCWDSVGLTLSHSPLSLLLEYPFASLGAFYEFPLRPLDFGMGSPGIPVLMLVIIITLSDTQNQKRTPLVLRPMLSVYGSFPSSDTKTLEWGSHGCSAQYSPVIWSSELGLDHRLMVHQVSESFVSPGVLAISAAGFSTTSSIKSSASVCLQLKSTFFKGGIHLTLQNVFNFLFASKDV